MTFCINAYKGLRYGNSGQAMLCCKSEFNLDDAEGNETNLQHQTFMDALQGKLATEIRNDLDNGIRHENCKKCWDEEDAGINSKRILDNARAEQYWGKEFVNDKKVEPSIVELNLGTECNMKCRICGPWSSSRWVKEHYELFTDDHQSYEDYKKQIKFYQGNWKETSPVWDNISKNISSLKQIDFYGGEPFMVKKNWQLLDKGIKEGYGKGQVLHFNTNGTYYVDEHIEILKKYRKVLISLSIDDIEDRFEYERSGGVWSEVSENIKKFFILGQEFKNIDVVVCITINNLNVYYIPEVTEYLDNMGMHYYVNFLHGPPYYNVTNIRENIKQKIVEKYKTFIEHKNPNQQTVESLNRVLDFMQGQLSTNNHWNDFVETTKKVDDYRKEQFDQVFPEWNKVIVEGTP